MDSYRVWTCKIVVKADAALPDGFDSPPRRAAIDAVANVVGDAYLACFSGWGGTLTSSEREVMVESQPRGGSAEELIEDAGGESVPDVRPTTFIDTVTVDGTLRYKGVPIMRWLADHVDLNEMAVAHDRGKFSTDEFKQFYRDIGYSLTGFEEIFGVYEGPEEGPHV